MLLYNNAYRFRMVVLADEILESFFETDLSQSFQLNPLPELDLPLPSANASGFLGDLWSSIATDSNKKMFNMFTDELGKSIGKHQVRFPYTILSLVGGLFFLTCVIWLWWSRLSTSLRLEDTQSWKNRKRGNRCLCLRCGRVRRRRVLNRAIRGRLPPPRLPRLLQLQLLQPLRRRR